MVSYGSSAVPSAAAQSIKQVLQRWHGGNKKHELRCLEEVVEIISEKRNPVEKGLSSMNQNAPPSNSAQHASTNSSSQHSCGRFSGNLSDARSNTRMLRDLHWDPLWMELLITIEENLPNHNSQELSRLAQGLAFCNEYACAYRYQWKHAEDVARIMEKINNRFIEVYCEIDQAAMDMGIISKGEVSSYWNETEEFAIKGTPEREKLTPFMMLQQKRREEMMEEQVSFEKDRQASMLEHDRQIRKGEIPKPEPEDYARPTRASELWLKRMKQERETTPGVKNTMGPITIAKNQIGPMTMGGSSSSTNSPATSSGMGNSSRSMSTTSIASSPKSMNTVLSASSTRNIDTSVSWRSIGVVIRNSLGKTGSRRSFSIRTFSASATKTAPLNAEVGYDYSRTPNNNDFREAGASRGMTNREIIESIFGDIRHPSRNERTSRDENLGDCNGFDEAPPVGTQCFNRHTKLNLVGGGSRFESKARITPRTIPMAQTVRLGGSSRALSDQEWTRRKTKEKEKWEAGKKKLSEKQSEQHTAVLYGAERRHPESKAFSQHQRGQFPSNKKAHPQMNTVSKEQRIAYAKSFDTSHIYGANSMNFERVYGDKMVKREGVTEVLTKKIRKSTTKISEAMWNKFQEWTNPRDLSATVFACAKLGIYRKELCDLISREVVNRPLCERFSQTKLVDGDRIQGLVACATLAHPKVHWGSVPDWIRPELTKTSSKIQMIQVAWALATLGYRHDEFPEFLLNYITDLSPNENLPLHMFLPILHLVLKDREQRVKAIKASEQTSTRLPAATGYATSKLSEKFLRPRIPTTIPASTPRIPPRGMSNARTHGVGSSESAAATDFSERVINAIYKRHLSRQGDLSCGNQSMLEKRVFETLRTKYTHLPDMKNQIAKDYGLSIDFCLKIDGRDTAVEVDGPSHFCLSPGVDRPLGKTLVKRKILEKLNIPYLSIPYFAILHNDSGQRMVFSHDSGQRDDSNSTTVSGSKQNPQATYQNYRGDGTFNVQLLWRHVLAYQNMNRRVVQQI